MAGPLQAEVPREFGKSLRACVCCKLVKTFDQVISGCFAARLIVTGAGKQRQPLDKVVRSYSPPAYVVNIAFRGHSCWPN